MPSLFMVLLSLRGNWTLDGQLSHVSGPVSSLFFESSGLHFEHIEKLSSCFVFFFRCKFFIRIPKSKCVHMNRRNPLTQVILGNKTHGFL